MKNIFNNELIELILTRIPNVKVSHESNRLIVSHSWEDWDMIQILAQRLGFVADRWMQNQEPRTSIYLQ